MSYKYGGEREREREEKLREEIKLTLCLCLIELWVFRTDEGGKEASKQINTNG